MKPRVGLHLLLADGDVDGDGVADVGKDGSGNMLLVEVVIEEVDRDNGIVTLKPTEASVAMLLLLNNNEQQSGAGKRRYMTMKEVTD
jgi:hypothetical protein